MAEINAAFEWRIMPGDFKKLPVMEAAEMIAYIEAKAMMEAIEVENASEEARQKS